MRAVRIWSSKYLVLGITVLWIRDDIRGFDCCKFVLYTTKERNELTGMFQIPTITMAYVSDCALPVNSDALLLVNGLKNIVAFGKSVSEAYQPLLNILGFLYGVVPWVDKVGYVDSFGTMAGIFVAIVGLGAVLLTVYGARVRHAGAQWKLILE
jgi:hypothetical protein